MSDEAEQTLLPCPFCGGIDAVGVVPDREFYGEDDGGFFVVCRNSLKGCGSSSSWAPTKHQAIAAWNRRAPNPLLESLNWAMSQIHEPRLLKGQNDSYVAAYAKAKAVLAVAWVDGARFAGDGSCEDCGRDALVWFAPNDLWNRVKGGPDATDDPGGLLCPYCFIIRAEALGICPTAWKVAPENLADESDALRAVRAFVSERDGEFSVGQIPLGGFTQKAIYNAVTYLKRTGEVERLGYGRYRALAPDAPSHTQVEERG